VLNEKTLLSSLLLNTHNALGLLPSNETPSRLLWMLSPESNALVGNAS